MMDLGTTTQIMHLLKIKMSLKMYFWGKYYVPVRINQSKVASLCQISQSKVASLCHISQSKVVSLCHISQSKVVSLCQHFADAASLVSLVYLSYMQKISFVGVTYGPMVN